MTLKLSPGNETLVRNPAPRVPAPGRHSRSTRSGLGSSARQRLGAAWRAGRRGGHVRAGAGCAASGGGRAGGGPARGERRRRATLGLGAGAGTGAGREGGGGQRGGRRAGEGGGGGGGTSGIRSGHREEPGPAAADQGAELPAFCFRLCSRSLTALNYKRVLSPRSSGVSQGCRAACPRSAALHVGAREKLLPDCKDSPLCCLIYFSGRSGHPGYPGRSFCGWKGGVVRRSVRASCRFVPRDAAAGSAGEQRGASRPTPFASQESGEAALVRFIVAVLECINRYVCTKLFLFHLGRTE